MAAPVDRFRVGAAVLLLVIIAAAVLYWPLPALGVATDPATGIVLAISEGSTGAQAGVQPGDQIVEFYGHPWVAFNTRLLQVPLPWRDGTLSPMTVRRNGQLLHLTLRAGRPDLALQLDKALRTLVALTCWITGVALGTSPQADNRRLQWTAWFWLLLGSALGVYQLVQSVSYVLTVVVLWVLGTLLAPAAVMMHVWYPSRPMARETLARAQRWWLASIGLLQVTALGLAALGGSISGLIELLDTSTTFVFLGSFILSALILWRAYRATNIAHIQRQIRLIAIACMIVACAWAVLVLGEVLTPQLIVPIPPVTLTVFAGIIPLAYLAGGVSADLLGIEQLARKIGRHACTFVVILALLAAAIQLGLLEPTSMLVAVVLLVAYQPVYQLVRRLGALTSGKERSVEGLSETMARLGSTLDAEQLAEIVSEGLRSTFREPAVAVYVRRGLNSEVLELATQRRLALPQTARTALLEQVFPGNEPLLPIGVVQQRVSQAALEGQDADLVFAPLVSLWSTIRDTGGSLVGLIILGPRGDLDPYRENDLREISRLMSAASLAFTNSASYERQVQAQQLIRRLYRHLQQAQEQTAARIAREIHDEVLNVNVRLNVMTLEHLIAQTKLIAPQLCDELEALLESEQTTGTLLRLICEQLRPADSDDPLGLAASLRRTIEQVAAGWEGQVRIIVEESPIAVDRQVHRELVLITREAIANAMKHAQATEIMVTLRFPAHANEPLTLTIADNGRAQQKVVSKPGHLGLHFMRESADAIGAAITWLRQDTGGIEVRVVTPIAIRKAHSLVSPADLWRDKESSGADDVPPIAVAVPDNTNPDGRKEGLGQ